MPTSRKRTKKRRKSRFLGVILGVSLLAVLTAGLSILLLKDVPGKKNRDPRILPGRLKLPRHSVPLLATQEWIILSFSGIRQR